MPENRRHVRFPEHLADREGLVFHNGHSLKALVIDESAGGLGVIVESGARLVQGQVLEFAEHGPTQLRRRFRVAHVSSQSEYSVMRVGLEWLGS